MAVKKSTAPKSSAKAAPRPRPRKKAAPKPRPRPRPRPTPRRRQGPQGRRCQEGRPQEGPGGQADRPPEEDPGRGRGQEGGGPARPKANAKQLAALLEKKLIKKGKKEGRSSSATSSPRPARSRPRPAAGRSRRPRPRRPPPPERGLASASPSRSTRPPTRLVGRGSTPPACLDLSAETRCARPRTHRTTQVALGVSSGLPAKIPAPSWPGHVPAIPLPTGLMADLGLSGSDPRCVREGMRRTRRSGRPPGQERCHGHG